jgi:hydrogenase expression/formation protein HypD
MKYVDEFRDRKLIDKLAHDIRRETDIKRIYNIMEVCGTHTMSIARFALRDILPANIKLISGPGCPVCVTPNEYIDKAIAIAGMKDVITATFGDMVRVPGSYSSLEKEKANGSDIRMVYSSLDALEIAEKHPGKEVVFLGIGFETTAPTVAQSLIMAKKSGIKNYSVLCGHKTMPEVLKMLVIDSSIKVDAFLLPGHVSAIIGLEPYRFLSAGYKKRCVISGFEPVDILQSILMLIKQDKPALQVQYNRVISRNGNPLARKSIDDVFEKTSSAWRGLGNVKNSGLKIKNTYKGFDAGFKFDPDIKKPKNNARCLCGHVLKGLKTPLDCPYFAKKCTPDNPIGACMVSGEGTCAAYYKYGVGSQELGV